MKKYKNNNIVKLVYRRRPSYGGFWRLHKFSDIYSSLASDYLAINNIAAISKSFTIHYVFNNQDITSWIDKHGNVIIRIIDLNVIQTNINF